MYLWHTPLYGLCKLICKMVNVTIEHSCFTMICFVIFVAVFSLIVYQILEVPVVKKINNVI